MIREKLQEDIKQAMKDRKKEVLLTLRSLMSEFKQVEIDSRKELTEDQCLTIIQKEVKKRRDTIKFAKQGGRDKMVAANEAEIKLLQNYLGDQLSEDKLRSIITDLVNGGADSIGAVMGALNQQYKGQFEGKVAAGMIKVLLG